MLGSASFFDRASDSQHRLDVALVSVRSTALGNWPDLNPNRNVVKWVESAVYFSFGVGIFITVKLQIYIYIFFFHWRREERECAFFLEKRVNLNSNYWFGFGTSLCFRSGDVQPGHQP